MISANVKERNKKGYKDGVYFKKIVQCPTFQQKIEVYNKKYFKI